jgi:hypothetical protein
MVEHLSVAKVTLLRTAYSMELVVVMVLSAGPSTGEGVISIGSFLCVLLLRKIQWE